VLNVLNTFPNRYRAYRSLTYADGEKTLHYCRLSITAGDRLEILVINATIRTGNTLKFSAIPLGSTVHVYEACG